jgi:hypothetical protein
LKVRYSNPSEVPALPRELPLTAAVMLREVVSLAEVLEHSKTIIEHLREAGVERARDAGMSARAPVLAVWMVPETVFDDNDWPGGTTGSEAARRLARRREAAKWLGREGVAFAPTAKHP